MPAIHRAAQLRSYTSICIDAVFRFIRPCCMSPRSGILPGPQPRAATLAQVSRRDTVRFHTGASGRLSGSGVK